MEPFNTLCVESVNAKITVEELPYNGPTIFQTNFKKYINKYIEGALYTKDLDAAIKKNSTNECITNYPRHLYKTPSNSFYERILAIGETDLSRRLAINKNTIQSLKRKKYHYVTNDQENKIRKTKDDGHNGNDDDNDDDDNPSKKRKKNIDNGDSANSIDNDKNENDGKDTSDDDEDSTDDDSNAEVVEIDINECDEKEEENLSFRYPPGMLGSFVDPLSVDKLDTYKDTPFHINKNYIVKEMFPNTFEYIKTLDKPNTKRQQYNKISKQVIKLIFKEVEKFYCKENLVDTLEVILSHHSTINFERSEQTNLAEAFKKDLRKLLTTSFPSDKLDDLLKIQSIADDFAKSYESNETELKKRMKIKENELNNLLVSQQELNMQLTTYTEKAQQLKEYKAQIEKKIQEQNDLHARIEAITADKNKNPNDPQNIPSNAGPNATTS